MAAEEETERTVDRSQLARATAPRLRLIVIGDDVVGTYPVPERGTIVIGRGDTCDVDVDHALISREHARLTIDGSEIRLEDLDSRNGTFVRGERLAAHEPVSMTAGQMFEVGETACLLQMSHAVARPRRLATHGYFEARVAEACARAARVRGSFAVLRIHVGDEVTLASMQAELSGADLVASYATGELEVLVEDVRSAEAIAANVASAFGARCHAAVFPSDGRTVDELLETACRGVIADGQETDLGIIVLDPAMKDLFNVVERVARGSISVLLLGETGVGKEVVADAIHRASPRRKKPFLRLNCAALSETLLDAELFGHEAGAFTGASEAKAGLIESADGGTVFLDELGEMPLSTQAKLLRVLEQRQVMRVGGRVPIDVDVRFVSATNRDLETAVVEGVFRQDVFFRLNGAALTIPPLRDRPEEIEALAVRFAAEAGAELGLTEAVEMTPDALDALFAYAWPGNVRELRNAIARAVLLMPGHRIQAEHLPMEKMSLPDDRSFTAHEDDERTRILTALRETAGNQTRAAQVLGIGRRTLTTKLTKYGIRRPRKR